MKQYDIFEKKNVNGIIRFQIVELNADNLTIQSLGTTPIITRSQNMRVLPNTNSALALGTNGEYESTTVGDLWINHLADSICCEVKARRISVLWLTSCKKMEQNDAETLVNDIIKKLPVHDVKYLMAVVRWVSNGELDINNETEVYIARRIFSDYTRSLLVKHNGNCDTLVFDGMCFKLLRVGQPAICLWTMKEVVWYLRSWEKKRVQNI